MGNAGFPGMGQLDPRALLRDMPALKGFNHQDLSAAQPQEAAVSLFPSGDGFFRSKDPTAAEQFDTTIYHAQMQRMAMALNYQHTSANVTLAGEDGAAPVTFQAEQMTFDFFAEMEVEDLAVFQQRTDAVAEGLQGSQKETYIELSRKVSASVGMSMSVSGVALSGFSKASEGLAETGSAMFDRFMGLVEDTLGSPDEIVNKVMGLLDGFFNGAHDFDAAFNRLIDDLYASGLFGSNPTGTSGGAQSTSFEFQFEFSFEFSAEIEIEVEGEVQQGDPLVLDLDGDGIELTHHSAGAQFDLLGDGSKVSTAFVTGGDAFLALDRNGNGLIDSGKELFGEQNGAANGFDELAKLDSNGDGVINKLDKGFDKLVLWKDNGNGETEDGELVSLAEAGITQIGLNYRNTDIKAAGGNSIAQTGMYRRADGTTGLAADALLNYIA